LRWNAYIGWDSVDAYDVYRVTDYDTNAVQYLGTVPGTDTTYTDSTVVCYEEYCYRVRARELGGFGEHSWSDTSCTRPIHIPNPNPLFICSASVLNDTFVELQWSVPTNARVLLIFLDKSLDGQNWQNLVQLPAGTTSYIDQNVEVHAQSYYYRISMVDSCGDLGPYSNIGRTILLEGELQQGMPYLEWNAYSQWPGGVLSYDIELFNDLTQAWQPVITEPGAVLNFLDLQSNLDQPIYCYRLYGNENGGGCRSLSNRTCVPVGPTLYAPNAFTPNGDGLNEFFELKGHFVAEYHIMIFDRWGMMVFESYDLGYHWNGKLHDQSCQEGVYVWVAEGRGFDGTEITINGSCTLIR
jgi:gliding motility-associated-like protein